MRISDWSSDVCSSDLLAVDVRASASVDAFVAKGVAAFGRIDGAVNNAGVEGRMCALHDAGDDDYADIMDVNARGLFRSEEHTSELQSLMRISYAVFCLKKKNILPQ